MLDKNRFVAPKTIPSIVFGTKESVNIGYLDPLRQVPPVFTEGLRECRNYLSAVCLDEREPSQNSGTDPCKFARKVAQEMYMTCNSSRNTKHGEITTSARLLLDEYTSSKLNTSQNPASFFRVSTSLHESTHFLGPRTRTVSSQGTTATQLPQDGFNAILGCLKWPLALH